MSKTRYLTAKEAAAELGITAQTLYAYVSRGLIRSEALGDDPRARRYSAEDVAKLKARKESRHNPEAVVGGALDWGMPVLDSAITLISDGNLYYRGLNALDLAAQQSVENVAALIWTGDLNTPIAAFDAPIELPPICQNLLPQIGTLPPFQRFQVLLPLIATDDLAAYDLRPETVAQTGGRILRLITLMACDAESSDVGIARTLAAYWKPDAPDAERLISTALILCADH